MNLYDAIQSLYEEKDKIDRAIAALMELQQAAEKAPPIPFPERRGRKSMGEDERRRVSQRMKKYWMLRRQRDSQPVAAQADPEDDRSGENRPHAVQR